MRDIKFRGKDVEANRWVYGGYFKHQKRTPCPIGDYIKEEDFEHLIISSGFSDWNMPKPIECTVIDGNTVGQYVGINDMNGKEIYTGDIVNMVYDGNLYTYVIVFDISEVGFKGTNGKEDYGHNFEYLTCCEEIEVIGNIYDNEELLKSISNDM